MIDLQEPFESSYDQVTQALKKLLEEQLQRKRIPEHSIANDLFFDALEAETKDETFDLLCEVIDLDAAHIDAHLARFAFLDLEPNQEISLLKPLLQLAEKRLGRKMFKECNGLFWGQIETRPYMRVKQRLAATFQEADQVDEAISQWEEMLELNPSDNQGVRYELLPVYLQLNRIDDARRLFDQYDEVEWSVIFAWGHVLWHYLQEDLAEASRATEKAHKQNPHMKPYLTGKKRIPKSLPAHYGAGSLEEAKCYAAPLAAAWKAHPSARKWLRDTS